MSLPADLRMRAVEAADIPGVVGLVARCDATYSEWAGEWRPPAAEEETERWQLLLERSDHCALGAFGEARVAGVVSWRQAVMEDGSEVPGVAHVGAVFTDPQRWRQGIAAHLLAAAMEEAARRGFRTARLWTPRDAPARGFYVREGWTLDGRDKWEPRFRLRLVGFERQLADRVGA